MVMFTLARYRSPWTYVDSRR